MEREIIEGKYLAPEVKVIVIHSQGVLCESYGSGTDKYYEDPWNPFAI